MPSWGGPDVGQMLKVCRGTLGSVTVMFHPCGHEGYWLISPRLLRVTSELWKRGYRRLGLNWWSWQSSWLSKDVSVDDSPTLVMDACLTCLAPVLIKQKQLHEIIWNIKDVGSLRLNTWRAVKGLWVCRFVGNYMRADLWQRNKISIRLNLIMFCSILQVAGVL